MEFIKKENSIWSLRCTVFLGPELTPRLQALALSCLSYSFGDPYVSDTPTFQVSCLKPLRVEAVGGAGQMLKWASCHESG